MGQIAPPPYNNLKAPYRHTDLKKLIEDWTLLYNINYFKLSMLFSVLLISILFFNCAT